MFKFTMHSIGLLAMLPALLVIGITTAHAARLVVTASSLQGWLLFNDGLTTPATAAFVDGPGTPPLGTGSYGTSIIATGEKFLLDVLMLLIMDFY